MVTAGLRPGWSSGGWAFPGSASQRTALQAPVPGVQDRVRLNVGGRPLWACSVQGGCVQFDFSELCEGLTSVSDFIEIAERYRTVVVSQVPQLASVSPDTQRRFANLVDVFWDRDIRLIVLAAGPPALVLDTPAITDHERMVSRLRLLPTI